MSVLPYMPTVTPNGRLIDILRGEPDEVQTRGQQIVDLGAEMTAAWSLIRRLVDDGADMEGDAIDTLRELCGDVSSDLSEAADLYTEVGPHILAYGGKLSTSKDTIDPLVEKLQDLWDEYYALSRAADTAEGAVPRKPDDDADADDQSAYNTAHEHAESQAGLASDKKAEWDGVAGTYDDAWDDWHDAFELAAKNIKEGVSGKIKDSTSDNIRGALEFLANVLAVAGIILAILAIVVGGPIIAALAAIVAVATLVVALTRKIGYNDGSWVDVAFGVIGVVPFLGPAAKGLRGLGAAGGWSAAGTAFKVDFFRLTGVGAASPAAWRSGLSALNGSTFLDKAADFSAGLFSGKNLDGWAAMGSSGRDALATVTTVWSQQLSLAGMIKDTAQGAFPGAFDPENNPFS